MSDWKLELARKGAEVLGLDIDDECIYEYACGDGFECRVFNPADDANDRDRLVEYFKLTVGYLYCCEEWCCMYHDEVTQEGDSFTDPDRATAINKCLCEIMGVEYDYD